MDKKPHKRVIGCDFDGTLAEYNGWVSVDHTGEPITEMVEKVKQALAEGAEVFIFTARVNPLDESFQAGVDAVTSYLVIAEWCRKYIGVLLPITSTKSRAFTEMWDDRAKGVVKNTGVFVEELFGESA